MQSSKTLIFLTVWVKNDGKKVKKANVQTSQIVLPLLPSEPSLLDYFKK